MKPRLTLAVHSLPLLESETCTMGVSSLTMSACVRARAMGCACSARVVLKVTTPVRLA